MTDAAAGVKAAALAAAHGAEITSVPPSGAFSDFDFGFHIPETATTHYLRDNGDGTWTMGMSQKVESILDHNKEMSTSGDHGWSKSKDFRRIGSIPLVVSHDWKTNKGIDIHSPDPDMQKKVNSMMNDIDYRRLRTAHWEV